MKNKSDLKRKVLCSLLAASTMGIFYSSDALAASVNGENPDLNKDGIITDAELENIPNGKGSHHFIIGQGDKITIGTNGNAGALVSTIIKDGVTLDEIRQSLADNANVGVIGGQAQFDGTVENLVGVINLADLFGAIELTDEQKALMEKITNINTTDSNIVSYDKDTNLTIGGIVDGEISNPVVIGMVGGDLSLNAGFVTAIGENSKPTDITEETKIERTGNINTTINTGNIIGGIGASASISINNLELKIPDVTVMGATGVTVDVNGRNATTTINGDVTTMTAEGSNANIGAFANGGAAVALGGQAESYVNGNSTFIIDSNVNVSGNVDGITAGISGGGMAVSTIGGTAISEVGGNANIGINNGLAVGVIGGGIAGSGDITGAAEAIKGGQLGNDNGVMDATGAQLEELLGTTLPDNMTITITNAIQGGEATATVKGDTNIELTGNTTAIGVIGGGVAAASHTYTWKNDGTNTEAGLGQDDVNKAFGSSKATADSGKATIVVDLESADPDNVAANIGGALSGIIGAVKDGDLSKINAEGVVGQGAVVGVFGGGMAFGQGSLRSTIDNAEEGAYVVATNDGADIILNKGYAAGVFGGGAAGTLNNAQAVTDTGAVNTFVGSGMKAVGLFGGGFAVSMEGEKGEDNYKGSTNGTLAYSNVESNNIEVYGDVDGIYGGGMAIGNSVLNSAGASDAATHVGETNITVNSGTIDRLQIISIMNASKNDNENGYPQWNTLGVNASMAMADLKGITDETSIAAGGMGMGMTGSDTVDVANITINGGNVTKDILGGGIAVDNMEKGSGAHVGTSTITLNGGTVGGSVYAGGAINGTTPDLVGVAYNNSIGYDAENTSSTVETAKVVLKGTEVTGEISGQGYELTTVYSKDNNYNPYYDGNSLSYEKAAYDSVAASTLEITGNNTLSALDTTKGSYVGTNKIHSFDSIDVMADSVTTLIGLTPETNAVIDATGTQVDVAGSAKLDINDFAKAENFGNTYKVISNTDETDKAWTDSNLVYDRTEGYAAGTEVKTGNYDITYKSLTDLNEEEQKKAVNDFVGSLGENGEELRGNVEGIVRNGDNTFAGAKDFFADATSTADNSGLAAMAMIGEAAGVTSNTIDVAGDMADNSVLRLSFTQDDITGEPTVNEDGAVWAKYIHNKHDLDGMASSFGSINSSSDFDGATIGVDFAKKGKVQSGIAFSYGDGDSHGMGINNDFDMWGLTLYGNVKNDDTNVIADIGFSESDNELTGNAMGKDIKADRDVSVFTVGVRAEKLYTNGSTQIVPYTGLRYYNVDPDSYTAYYDGQKFGEYDADRQNIWTLPVGVSLRNETVTESGWRLTPKVDVAYIWAFGDTDNSFDLNTGSGVDTLDYTVMDSGSWLGSVGFEAGKDDWAFGVGYSYQKGSHEEANKWFVNVEYSF